MQIDGDGFSRIKPSLIIGIGGTGIRVLCQYKRELWRIPGLDKVEEERRRLFMIRLLGLDTNKELPENDKNILTSSEVSVLSLSGTVSELRTQPPISYWAERMLADKLQQKVGGGAGAGQSPTLGRLCLCDNILQGKEGFLPNVIKDRLKGITNSDFDLQISGKKPEVDNKIQVYIICSTAGGTGAGMAKDVAALIRQTISAKSKSIDRITGIFVLPDGFENEQNMSPEEGNLQKANTYAFLKELDFYLNGGKWQVHYSEDIDANLPKEEMLFNEVYLLNRNSPENRDGFLNLNELVVCISDFLLYSTLTKIFGKYKSKESNLAYIRTKECPTGPKEDILDRRYSLYGSFGVADTTYELTILKVICYNRVCRNIVEELYKELEENISKFTPDRKVFRNFYDELVREYRFEKSPEILEKTFKSKIINIIYSSCIPSRTTKKRYSQKKLSLSLQLNQKSNKVINQWKENIRGRFISKGKRSAPIIELIKERVGHELNSELDSILEKLKEELDLILDGVTNKIKGVKRTKAKVDLILGFRKEIKKAIKACEDKSKSASSSMDLKRGYLEKKINETPKSKNRDKINESIERSAKEFALQCTERAIFELLKIFYEDTEKILKMYYENTIQQFDNNKIRVQQYKEVGSIAKTQERYLREYLSQTTGTHHYEGNNETFLEKLENKINLILDTMTEEMGTIREQIIRDLEPQEDAKVTYNKLCKNIFEVVDTEFKKENQLMWKEDILEYHRQHGGKTESGENQNIDLMVKYLKKYAEPYLRSEPAGFQPLRFVQVISGYTNTKALVVFDSGCIDINHSAQFVDWNLYSANANEQHLGFIKTNKLVMIIHQVGVPVFALRILPECLKAYEELYSNRFDGYPVHCFEMGYYLPDPLSPHRDYGFKNQRMQAKPLMRRVRFIQYVLDFKKAHIEISKIIEKLKKHPYNPDGSSLKKWQDIKKEFVRHVRTYSQEIQEPINKFSTNFDSKQINSELNKQTLDELIRELSEEFEEIEKYFIDIQEKMRSGLSENGYERLKEDYLKKFKELIDEFSKDTEGEIERQMNDPKATEEREKAGKLVETMVRLELGWLKELEKMDLERQKVEMQKIRPYSFLQRSENEKNKACQQVPFVYYEMLRKNLSNLL